MGFFTSLIAQIGADTKDFDRGIRKCELMAGKFAKNTAKSIAGIGAGYLTVNYAIGLISESFERAGNVKDLSDRLDIDIELLQEFQYAAKQTGTEVDIFSKSIQNINKARAEALGDPSGEKANIFARYGIGLKELQRMSGEDIFLRIGDSVKEVANPQNELVIATKVLGNVAAKVFPAMREGLRDLAVEARKAGEVIDKDLVKRMDDTQDKYEAIKRKTGNLFVRGIVGAYDIVTGALSGAARGMSGASPMAPMNYADMATQKSEEGKKEPPKKKKENFEPAKENTSTFTPTEWAYKAPSGDSLRDIGGFTSAAQNAQIANLEKIKDAVEKTAESTGKTAAIMEDDGGSPW